MRARHENTPQELYWCDGSRYIGPAVPLVQGEGIVDPARICRHRNYSRIPSECSLCQGTTRDLTVFTAKTLTEYRDKQASRTKRWTDKNKEMFDKAKTVLTDSPFFQRLLKRISDGACPTPTQTKQLQNILAKNTQSINESNFVGEIGDSITLNATVDFTLRRSSGDYNPRMITLRDDRGNVYVWGVPERLSLSTIRAGWRVEISGIIYKHQTYNNVKQTFIHKVSVLNEFPLTQAVPV